MSQTNTIYEDLVFRDQATPGLKRVGAEVGGVAKAIGGIKSLFGPALGLGGLFAVNEAVGNVSALYERVRRLTSSTGLAAAEVHGLADAFELTGTEDGIADRTITRLAALGQKAAGAGKEASELRAKLRGVGVDMSGGVTKSLLGMSAAVKAGKLGVADMARTFKIPLAQSGQLMATLQQGPAKLQAIINDTKGGADVVDEDALAAFQKMKEGKLKMHDAWEGLVGTLYKKLLPGATALVDALTNGINAVAPVAEAIGGILSRHMGLIVGLAKAYLGYMVAAKAASMIGINLGGVIKGQLGKVIVSRAAGAAAGGGGLLSRVAAGASAVPGMGGLGSTLGRIASSAVSFRAIGTVIGRFGIAGAALAVGARVFTIMKNDIGGHRTRIVGMMSDIVGKFASLGKIIMPVLAVLGKLFGVVINVAAQSLLYAFEYTLFVIKGILTLVQAIAYFIADLVTTAPWNWGASLFTNAWRKANASSESLLGGAKDKKTGSNAGGSGTTVNQDFRGSKFTIENKFAEGFDPGRVATAITEGIATAGQRRLQSGFAPLFAMRGG